MHETQSPDQSPTGPIRNPKQFLLAVFLGFVVPIAVIIGLVTLVVSANKPAAGVGEADALRALEARIKPIGWVAIDDPDRAPMTGEQVYQARCIGCHSALGNAKVWAPRIARGFEALLQSVMNGKGAMPPRAGGGFKDVELGRALVYMANAAGGDLVVPDRLEKAPR